MRLDIINKMADRMEMVDQNQLTLSYWKREQDCGTVACIVGHCWDLIPGLTLAITSCEDGIFYSPRAKGEDGVIAVYEALEITYQQALNLFFSMGYGGRPNPTIQDVVTKLRSFVEENSNGIYEATR